MPEGFAARWQQDWNGRDLDVILRYLGNLIAVRLRKAAVLAGKGTFLGKSGLRAVWARALPVQPDMRIRITQVCFGHEATAIAYRNHTAVAAAQTLRFGPDSLVTAASPKPRLIQSSLLRFFWP